MTRSDAHNIDFFELLRQLESTGKRFGRGGGAHDEPARLGQPIRLAFATTDIVSFSQDQGLAPPKVSVNVVGLFGPEGPMPLHLTRWMLERASNRWFSGDDATATSDTAFLDFGNMLQHRMIALFWRAWADARPEVDIEHGSGGRASATVRALAGTGLETTKSAKTHVDAKIKHATSLFCRLKSPERLIEYLATVTGVPVALREFVGTWTEIPNHLQSQLGTSGSTLGGDAVVGARFFERASHAEIRLGPLDIEQYKAFLYDASIRHAIRHAVTFAMGHEISFDLRLTLKASEVPEPRLHGMRLGQVSWLGKVRTPNAEDMLLRRITDTSEQVAA